MKNTDAPCRKCGAVDYDEIHTFCKPCKRAAVRAWRERKKNEDPDAWRVRTGEYSKQYRQTFHFAVGAARRKDAGRKSTEGRRRYTKAGTPPWLTRAQRDEIRAIYRRARDYTELAGEPYHVDHEIPLRGRTVCGLHVPWNLRVVRGVDNLRKSNSVRPE